MIEQGYYVGRFIRRGLRWHLVESKIADRYITRCGRQMQENHPNRGRVEFTDIEGDAVLRPTDMMRHVSDLCRQCHRQLEERT